MRRQYRSRTSWREVWRNAASQPTSSSLIQTYPGAPVQQFPHCWQVKASPSANQGISVAV
jgi:hypothetical protein